MSYADMLARIGRHDDRPSGRALGFNLTPVASVVAAAVAGEDLGADRAADGIARTRPAAARRRSAAAFGVRLHRFEAAVERALREWEGNWRTR